MKIPHKTTLSRLQASLKALRDTDFFRLLNGFQVPIFRKGLHLFMGGSFELYQFYKIPEDDVKLTLRIAGYRVTFRGQPFRSPSRQILFDAFRVHCECKEEKCFHRACAGVVLHRALHEQFEKVSPEAQQRLRAIRKKLLEILEEPVLESEIHETGDAQFTALLFCIDEDQEAWISKLIPKFETQILPTSRAFSRHPSWPQSDNLPYTHRHLQELPFELQYHFSDGTILDAHQIFSHRYKERVPPTTLISFHKGLEELNPFTSNRTTYSGFDLEKNMLLVLKSIFENSPKDSKDRNWKVQFVVGREVMKKRPAIEIQSLEFLKASQIPIQEFLKFQLDASATHSGKGEAYFQATMMKKGIPFLRFVLDTETHALFFHPYGQIWKTLGLKLGESSHFHGMRRGESPYLPQKLVHYKLTGHEKIRDAIVKIETERTLKNIDFQLLPARISLEETALRCFFSIEPTGAVGFGGRISSGNQSFQMRHPTDWGKQLLLSFQTGLQSFLPYEKRRFVPKQKQFQRDNDLSLLSHLGIHSLLVYETLSFVLDRQDGDGNLLGTKEEFEKSVFPKIATLLSQKHFDLKELHKDRTTLEALISPQVQHFLRNWIDEMEKQIQKDEVAIYKSEGEILLKGYNRAFARFLQSLLRYRILQTKGECLLKPRASILVLDPVKEFSLTVMREGDPAKSISPLQFQGWSAQELAEALLPLSQYGYDVTYHGLPIEGLDASNFKAEFVLSEEEASGGAEDPKRINWFDLHPHFFLNGIEIDPKKVKEMGKSGLFEWNGKLYLLKDRNLPSIQYLERFWGKISKGATKDGPRNSHNLFLRLPRNQTLELLSLRKSGVSIQGNKGWEEICTFYDSLSSKRDPIVLPDSFHGELKHYQQDGVGWLQDLYHLRLGGILADDMGLGKTIQTLAFLEILRRENKLGHLLIIVPTSLGYNWLSEAQKFTPDLPLRIFQSKEKAAAEAFLKETEQAGLICTYGLFVEHADFFRQLKWNIHIYDEAQNLKTITTRRAHASRNLPARFKLCLTGTPLENHLGEFYSLLDLAVPGCLGEFDEFRKIYVNPPEVLPENMAALRLKVKPLILRRNKSEILNELPQKTESLVPILFEEKQKKIYRDIAISWNEKVKESVENYGEAKSQIVMLTALLRLRQACSDPASLPQVKYPTVPPKVSLLIDSLQEIVDEGHSALVFTQFLATYERIRNHLSEKAIPHFSMYGGHSHAHRQKEIQGFQNHPTGSVMLMTLKTGGVGLNLTKAAYVFHIEPWWNPAVENQATDRAHRIGQSKNVQVYRYLMKESVEEKIEILKDRKKRRFEDFLGTGAGTSEVETESEIKKSSSRLSREDFEYLVSDREE